MSIFVFVSFSVLNGVSFSSAFSFTAENEKCVSVGLQYTSQKGLGRGLEQAWSWSKLRSLRSLTLTFSRLFWLFLRPRSRPRPWSWSWKKSWLHHCVLASCLMLSLSPKNFHLSAKCVHIMTVFFSLRLVISEWVFQLSAVPLIGLSVFPRNMQKLSQCFCFKCINSILLCTFTSNFLVFVEIPMLWLFQNVWRQ